MKRELKIGETYNVRHSRRGSFQLKLTKTDDVWVTGIITKGKATAVLYYNAAEVGEEVTLRIAFCSFLKI